MVWKNDQVSAGETEKIVEIARECAKLPGDFVEMGCYKGDTSLLLAEVLRDYQGVGCGKPVEKPVDNPVENYAKKLWIYDSFEGLPEKRPEDEAVLGVDFREGELLVTKREVKERFLRTGLPLPVIKKGWFSELTEVDLPPVISFAFLDGDFYESIKISLNLVEDKMVGWGTHTDGFDNVVKNTETGVIIVHDYNNLALPGVKKAVDEWLMRLKRNGAKTPEIKVFESMAMIDMAQSEDF